MEGKPLLILLLVNRSMSCSIVAALQQKIIRAWESLFESSSCRHSIRTTARKGKQERKRAFSFMVALLYRVSKTAKTQLKFEFFHLARVSRANLSGARI